MKDLDFPAEDIKKVFKELDRNNQQHLDEEDIAYYLSIIGL